MRIFYNVLHIYNCFNKRYKQHKLISVGATMVTTTTVMRCSPGNAFFRALKPISRNPNLSNSLPLSSYSSPITKGSSFHSFPNLFDLFNVLHQFLWWWWWCWSEMCRWIKLLSWRRESIRCIVVGCWRYPLAVDQSCCRYLCRYWIQIWLLSSLIAL